MKSNRMAGSVALAMALLLVAAPVFIHETAAGGANAASQDAGGRSAADNSQPPAKESPFDGTNALDISQAALGGVVSPDHAFIDSRGRPVTLEQFRGKPLIISLIFTSCYHVCPMITENLHRAVAVAQDSLGKDSFSVLTIGFDTRVDTPARMAAFGKDHGVNLPNWHLVSTNEETIRRLAEEVGFIFFPTTRGFDHLAQTTIVDRDGAVYRQVYGAAFTTPNIVEPVKELVFGRVRDFSSIDGIVNRIRLFCTLYDPRDDRYYFDYSVFIGIAIGFVILTTIATILVRNIWRLWRQQRA